MYLTQIKLLLYNLIRTEYLLRSHRIQSSSFGILQCQKNAYHLRKFQPMFFVFSYSFILYTSYWCIFYRLVLVGLYFVSITLY